MEGIDLVVMSEQQLSLRRETHVFIRGNWLDKGEAVEPGIPQVLGTLPEGRNDRLAMARWLGSSQSPLTARVAVNRFWEQLFGVGLVETLEDFGPSGQPPSHPALLDFLAVRFQRELGWSVKGLLREIVLSATYRQSSRTSSEQYAKDPQNRLLARGPRRRLSAEMVRDNALAVSGLLSPKMYGPSVMPPQPEGLGQAPYSNEKWVTAEGEDRYRRGVYTLWRRSNAYPSMVTFDAPNRLVCTARRVTTNTPLQALVTLNDPVYVECAVALAKRMAEECPTCVDDQIAHGYRVATGRAAADEDLKALRDLYDQTLAVYAVDTELSRKLAENPALAALSVVANAILNLDSVLTK
jgi:hypothetical protein